MPTTVADAFAAAGLTRNGVVRWGSALPIDSSGIYIVALGAPNDSNDACLPKVPFDTASFDRWLVARPELTLDGIRPTSRSLMNRLRQFWLPDERILYIGKATSLASRVGQYYSTPLGARQPHAGGYFLKVLSNLDALWVHYAACPDPSRAESRALQQFVEGVSEDTKRTLLDPAHPFPFANLEWPQGIRKAHGIRGAREPRQTTSARIHEEKTLPTQSVSTPFLPPAMGAYRTQRVTAVDLKSGRIRIPAAGSAPTKVLFPSDKSTVRILLRGQSVTASWDPRMGPDRERSGVLRVGAVLRELVNEDETLTVVAPSGSAVTIM